MRPWVESFFVQESDAPRTYSILPEVGLVMGFQYSGRLSVIENSGQTSVLEQQGITGLLASSRTIQSSGHIGSVLVKFRPAGARSFLRVPASELRQQSVPLAPLSTADHLNRVQDRLALASDDASRIEAVEDFLLRSLVPLEADLLVDRALTLIERRAGWIRVADLADRLGTSISPLERRFNDRVGIGPKKYADLVRLRRVIDRVTLDPTNLTDWAMRLGFYDQAHFIHEFQRMTGMTPRRFVESGYSNDEFLQFEG